MGSFFWLVVGFFVVFVGGFFFFVRFGVFLFCVSSGV